MDRDKDRVLGRGRREEREAEERKGFHTLATRAYTSCPWVVLLVFSPATNTAAVNSIHIIGIGDR